ncbi:hypothetical protein DOY81_006938, partial [Sarcophaga bullata]
TILCGALLIHLTVFIAKHYIAELNRSAAINHNSVRNSKTNNSLKANDLINITDWKNTLESIDMRNFTMNPKNTPEKENLPKIASRQHSYCFEELLDAVSLPNVVYNLFQTSPTPLCGTMFLFSVFYIWLHLIAEYSFMANNMDLGLTHNKVKQRDAIIKRSAYLMDIYFLIK